MQQNLKKPVSTLAAIALIPTILTGCSTNKNKNASNQSSDSMMGRYVESDVKMPEEIKPESNIISLSMNSDHKLSFVLCDTTKTSLLFDKYTQNEDESWSKETIAEFPMTHPESCYDTLYSMDENGVSYLSYANSSDNKTPFHFFKIEGQTPTEIISDDWNLYDAEEGYTYTPNSWGVTSDGKIVMYVDRETRLYDDSGKVLETLPYTVSNYYNFTSFSKDKIIYQKYNDKTYEIDSIVTYDLKNKTETSIATESSNSNESLFTYDDQNNLYTVTNDGVQLNESGSSLWQTIVDGSLTSLYLPNFSATSLAIDTQKEKPDYYILGWFDTGISIHKFSYDDSISSIPSQELTLYSLKDNYLIRQAIVSFQREHPDVKVSLHAMVTDSFADIDDTTITDYVRSLNTSLLAGNGEDLIVLDDLPYQSFIDKGVLCDITDVIQPLIDSNEVLPNVIKDFECDGKYYCAPTKIRPNIIFGNKDAGTTCTTLDGMVKCAKENSDRPFFGEASSTYIIDTLAPVYMASTQNEDGTYSKEKLTTLLSQLKVLFDASNGVSALTTDNKELLRKSSSFDLPYEAFLSISQSFGTYDSAFDFAIIDYIKGSMGSLENSYVPYGTIGINNSCKNKELAKEFISILYSQEVQELPLFEGFSVRTSVINNIPNEKYDGAETEITGLDGNPTLFQIESPKKEQLNSLVTLIQSLDHCCFTDTIVLSKFKTYAEQYLADQISLDDAANKLVSELSMINEE